MRVFIAGATGVLGRRLVEQLSRRGQSVAGLVRSPEGEQVVRSLGGEPRWADLFNTDSLGRAAAGCDVLIHAATAIPTKQKISPQDWEMNDRIRRKGTRALTEAAGQIGAKVFLQQSIVWVARPEDGTVFDEDSLIVPNRVMQSAADAEGIAREAGARSGFTTAILRCGMFYSADATHTRMFGESLRRRRMPIIGAGDAVWGVLHSDDAAGAFVTVAEKPAGGLWHVVDNVPATVGEFLTLFAREIGARTPRRAPVWLARLLAGDDAVRFLTTSTRTANTRFRRDFGWAPRFPSYREGLSQIAAEWKQQGSPPR